MKYERLRPKNPNRIVPDPFHDDLIPYPEGRLLPMVPYFSKLKAAGELEPVPEDLVPDDEVEVAPPEVVSPVSASELLGPSGGTVAVDGGNPLSGLPGADSRDSSALLAPESTTSYSRSNSRSNRGTKD